MFSKLYIVWRFNKMPGLVMGLVQRQQLTQRLEQKLASTLTLSMGMVQGNNNLNYFPLGEVY